ncbi:MAG TPA: hypothetical protein VF060_27410 [Trebonia sp.]
MINEELIQMLATATRAARAATTTPRLAALQASLNQACRIPAGLWWDRKAAAHAEFFNALADAADPCAALVLNYAAGFVYDLMITAGRAADGMTIDSRRHVLAHLSAADLDGAALEMERHLRILSVMSRRAATRTHSAA